MVVEFPTFCCGVSLKRGTAIIGFVQSILSFIFMILCAAYANNPHELVDMSDPSIIPNTATLKSLLIVTAVANAVQCVVSILIIFGAETNRPKLLLPWLVLNPLTVVVYVIGTLIVIIEYSGMNSTSFMVSHLFVGALVSVIGGYNVVTVYSYYKHLKSLNF